MLTAFRWTFAVAATIVLVACGKHGPAQSASADPAPAIQVPEEPRIPAVQLPPNEMADIAVGAGANQALTVSKGQAAKGGFIAPRAGEVIAIDVELGNYVNTSDGKLKTRLCDLAECRAGEGDLMSSLDNRFFSIALAQSLTVAAGDQLSYEFEKDGGDVAVAIWTYPPAQGEAMTIAVDDALPTNRAPKLRLRYAK